MKTTELRIRNWINSYHGEVQVTMLNLNAPPHGSIFTTPNRIGASSGCIYTPIELTEQWLKDFYFKKDKEGYYVKGKWSFLYNERFKCWNGFIQQANGVFNLPNLQYVHTLQNLCFALTSKELNKMITVKGNYIKE